MQSDINAFRQFKHRLSSMNLNPTEHEAQMLQAQLATIMSMLTPEQLMIVAQYIVSLYKLPEHLLGYRGYTCDTTPIGQARAMLNKFYGAFFYDTRHGFSPIMVAVDRILNDNTHSSKQTESICQKCEQLEETIKKLTLEKNNLLVQIRMHEENQIRHLQQINTLKEEKQTLQAMVMSVSAAPGADVGAVVPDAVAAPGASTDAVVGGNVWRPSFEQKNIVASKITSYVDSVLAYSGLKETTMREIKNQLSGWMTPAQQSQIVVDGLIRNNITIDQMKYALEKSNCRYAVKDVY